MPAKLKCGCCTVRHTDLKSFEYLQSTYFINTMSSQALEAVKCQQIFILLWKEVLHTSVRGSFGVQSKLKTNCASCVASVLYTLFALAPIQTEIPTLSTKVRKSCL